MLKPFLAAALAAGLAGAAQAATVAFAPLPAVVAPDPGGTPSPGATYRANLTVSEPEASSPFDGTALAGSPFSAVYGGSASYAFDAPRDVLTFVWGSPDDYNLLTFLKGGVEVDALAGSRSFPGLLDRYATVRAAPFDEVRFASTRSAFEYAYVGAAMVPLPAGGLLLLTALGAAALAARRRAR